MHTYSHCNTVLRYLHATNQKDIKAGLQSYFEAVPNSPLTQFKGESNCKRFVRVLKILYVCMLDTALCLLTLCAQPGAIAAHRAPRGLRQGDVCQRAHPV